ncbi:PALP domain-containing protein [Fusarium falciforme]|uniref:PALP domain-containing protein n=1 Tax=Fusarium falciforme TaxID=195108 RepID=UPI00230028C5|nr:PALP domain-containing protein [Fusarium falciforme]WAO92240.1 PALP domain-containing protein [Fusarium falciforme]
MAPPVVNNVLDAIGNTLCVRLKNVIPEGCAEVYLKLEYFNPTGSYKDRMAKSIIEEAEKRGGLRPGMTVVEASGGSTGSSLALVCAAKGYNCHIVTSNVFAVEKLRTMGAFGTHVEIILSPSGKIHADLIPSMIRRVIEHSQDPQMYWTDQFNNRDAFEGYKVLGSELVDQFPNGVDAFCSAVGTAGMAIGVSSVLKGQWPECRVAVLEPASSPCISRGEAGTHHIEGIGIGIIPPLLDEKLYDHAWAIEEEEARAMCRRLAKEEGLLLGTSTGLNVVGAIRLAQDLGPGKIVVTVACDTGLKYMNGHLFTAS